MTLARRLTLAIVLTVIAVVLAISLAVAVVSERILESRADANLAEAAARMGEVVGKVVPPGDVRCQELAADAGLPGPGVEIMVLAQRGRRTCTIGISDSKVTEAVRSATRQTSARSQSGGVDRGAARVAVQHVQRPDGSIRVAAGLPRAAIDEPVRRMLAGVAGAGLIGIGIALVLSRVLAARALRPVHKLSSAIDRTVHTRDLGTRVDVPQSGDELANVGIAFNDLLGVLQRAQEAQRQLIADVSHELRTPIAGIRSNIELLYRIDELQPSDITDIVTESVGQLDELTVLVSDLVELARDEEATAAGAIEVDVVVLCEEAIARMRKIAPSHVWTITVEGAWLARGDRNLLARAISNMCSNAARYAPAGTEVNLSTRPGTIAVRDRGPGFDVADIPFVFDRFWRGGSARAIAGSGLGLAIVRRAADSHGGHAIAANAEGGGAVVSLHIPPAQESSDLVSGSLQGGVRSSG